MLTEKQKKQIINKCPQGFRVIAIMWPTRGFRVTCSDDERTFRSEQLRRDRGDKWVVLKSLTGLKDKDWTAPDAQYANAINDAIAAQNKFLQEVRQIRVQQNTLQRAQDAGAKI